MRDIKQDKRCALTKQPGYGCKEEGSRDAGERHREAAKRVNSGRSRAGKAARWQ